MKGMPWVVAHRHTPTPSHFTDATATDGPPPFEQQYYEHLPKKNIHQKQLNINTSTCEVHINRPTYNHAPSHFTDATDGPPPFEQQKHKRFNTSKKERMKHHKQLERQCKHMPGTHNQANPTLLSYNISYAVFFFFATRRTSRVSSWV